MLSVWPKFGLAPWLSSIVAVRILFTMIDFARGVMPFLSAKLTSTFFASRNRTSGVFDFCAAIHSTVRPFTRSLAFKSQRYFWYWLLNLVNEALNIECCKLGKGLLRLPRRKSKLLLHVVLMTNGLLSWCFWHNWIRSYRADKLVKVVRLCVLD